MRAKEISLSTPIYSAHWEYIQTHYPTSIGASHDDKGDYVSVQFDGGVWGRFRTEENKSFSGTITLYLNLADAQKAQLEIRKIKAEEVRKSLKDVYKRHETAQRMLYSPLSEPIE